MGYSPYPFFYEPSKFNDKELVLWCKALNDWDCNHLQNEVFVSRVLPEIISGYHNIVEDRVDMNFDILAKHIVQWHKDKVDDVRPCTHLGNKTMHDCVLDILFWFQEHGLLYD